MVSVAVVPLPPSHIFQEPVCAGRPVLFVIGPAVPVQLAAPDSKPGLSSRLPPVGGGVGAAAGRGAGRDRDRA